MAFVFVFEGSPLSFRLPFSWKSSFWLELKIKLIIESLANSFKVLKK